MKKRCHQGEPESIREAREGVRFAQKKLDVLLAGKCVDCGTKIPRGFNLCAGCGDERGP